MTSGFNFAGLGLVILAFAFVGVEIAVNKWIKKVTNTYWMWMAIAICYLIYCITVCWSRHWANLSVLNIEWGKPMSVEDSSMVSLALLLNICPFANFALCVTLIADPSRKAARAVAPLAVLASIFVLFVNILPDQNATFTWQYIFFGTEEHPDTHYSGHVINLLIGIGVLLNTPRLGWKGTVAAYGYALGFFLYTTIISYSTGVQYYCSGVNPKDFIEGTYKFFDGLFPGAPWKSMLFLFSGEATGLFVTCLLVDVCKKGYFIYGDQYSGTWWRWYNYDQVVNTKPWGWFSDKWQSSRNKNKLWFNQLKVCKTNNFYK